MNENVRLSSKSQSLAPPHLVFLGAGAVVRDYYLPACALLGMTKDVVVLDQSAEGLESIRHAHPHVRVQRADFRELTPDWVRRQGIDAAVVALPNWLHEEATLRALDCGLHVLCEKPLTLQHEACLRLAGRARAAGRVLSVGMVRRLLPSVVAASDALRRGLIGDLDSITIEDGGPYAWPAESGAAFDVRNGGVLADMGVHYLDLVEHLVGPLEPASYSDDYSGGVEANAAFCLRTQAGVVVRLALSRTRKLHDILRFEGTLGELTIEKDAFDHCLWRARGTKIVGTLAASEPFAADWPLTLESCFAQQLTQFGSSIGQGTKPIVSADEAASTIRLLEWAYRNRELNDQSTRYLPRDDYPGSSDKVVVTGGTGFIGSHLVERLAAIGCTQIIAPIRSYRTCAEVARFPVALPRVDLLNPREVRAAVDGSRWVFHLAYGRDGPGASRVTVEGTRNVVEAAIAAGSECVVVLSTMFVFGNPEHSSVDESWPYRPTGGEYGQSKARMERWCLQRSRSSPNTRIVVLNPSCVYGPRGETFVEMPLRLAESGALCWIEDGRGLANYVFIENLLDAMLAAAASPRAHGERFIISDGVTSWREYLTPLLGGGSDRMASYTRRQLQELHRLVPRPSLLDIARMIASKRDVIDGVKANPVYPTAMRLAGPLAPKLLGKARKLGASTPREQPATALPLPPLWLADLFGPTSTVFSAHKAHKVLGWAPRIDLPKGQKATVASLRYHPFEDVHISWSA